MPAILVITRRPQERFFVGDNVVITIVEIEPGKIRVGIDAPPNIKVFREELLSVPEAAAITHAAKGGRS